jgi:hypothetical protein
VPPDGGKPGKGHGRNGVIDAVVDAVDDLATAVLGTGG